ncbi:23S rRNA (cytidine1920-2'-O)/16S rRNA (cytidine1409-2'-O)-methyltransferase [Desulfitispora alkaliphila]|uniref:TlyA family RNA methyltransferase n=1 Tax=Desulfitispora alkaliphila TaxID=622674 RepID=UPI003D1D92EA
MTKERIDLLLVEKGHFESRERAKTSIMAGNIYVDNKVIDKPGTKVDSDAHIIVKGSEHPYVSRGGLKLEKAIAHMGFKVEDKIVLDVGASTGGFTDCALQNGAKKVYAVDVGYGQLAWKLRQDSRVVNMERTNIRYVEELDESPDVVTIDVAFISLTKVLPVVKKLIASHGQVLALIKPQFEAGKDKVGKKGVVKDSSVHEEVIIRILEFSAEVGFELIQITHSPIKGPEGNVEYLCWLKEEDSITKEYDQTVIAKKVVAEAFKEL